MIDNKQYIWRVENKKGEGCYWGKNTPIKKWLCNKHDNKPALYPTPKLDKGIKREPENNEICGFSSLKQAKEWFTEKELEIIKKEGFLLQKIIVNKITIKGIKQVLAIR